MTTLYEDTNPRSLRELLSEVHNGTAVLPDFQRDFVWDAPSVDELVVSIANNFPAGSLLRIRNSQEYFAWRPFQGSDRPPGKPTFLVLDGQQRLTSLFQAFYGVGTFRFFLDVGKLIAGEDIESALFHARYDRRPATDLLPRNDSLEEKSRALAVQVDRMVMPLGTLRASMDSFNSWKLEVVKLHGVELLAQLEEVGKRWIAPIDGYAFPVVTLSDRTSADAVCTIFETLNRTGVKLTPFELLTARFFSQDLNLRTLWQDALEQNPILEEFGVDPYAILQAITLRVNRPVTVKRSALMELSIDQIRANWEATVEALASGLEFLREDCGVMAPKWLPYTSMLTPLAAVVADRPLKGGANAGARRAKIARWFWSATLGQVYESAANRKAELDYEQLVSWMDGGKEPASIATFSFEGEFETITPRQRALYRALMCLVLAGGARDFHSNQPMSAALIRSQSVDDHHIFPLDFLGEKNRRSPDPKNDNILNRTLIDAETNKRIGGRGPKSYLAEIDEAQGQAAVNEILQSHGINQDGRLAAREENYDAFLAARRSYFNARITEVAAPAVAGNAFAVAVQPVIADP